MPQLKSGGGGDDGGKDTEDEDNANARRLGNDDHDDG